MTESILKTWVYLMAMPLPACLAYVVAESILGETLFFPWNGLVPVLVGLVVLFTWVPAFISITNRRIKKDEVNK